MDGSDERAGEDERESIQRYYEQLTPEERRARILLEPAYRDAYNEITQAHRTVDQPAYFWERWIPILGPVAAVLYMKLRQYCFGRVNESEVCWPKQETLGREIGVRCRERLRAALELLEQHGFIQREPSSRLPAGSGVPIRTADRYRVFFEIPLRPEDAAEVLIRSVYQLPLGLDSQKAGIPPIGSRVEKAGIPPFGKTGPDEKAVFPPFGDGPESGSRVEKVGIPPFRDASETSSRVEKAGIPPFREPPSQKAVFPLAEVNVQRLQRSTLSRRDSRLLGNDKAEDLARELAEELDDERSLKWYRLVADKLPEELIRRILSETRGAKNEGRLRGAPGAYFTAAIRRQAGELGISL